MYSVCVPYIYAQPPLLLKSTNTKLAKPSSRELGNAGVTVLSNLNSISLCLCLLESLTTSSHCHLILCTGCLPCSVPAWRGLSLTAAIQCFVFSSLFTLHFLHISPSGLHQLAKIQSQRLFLLQRETDDRIECMFDTNPSAYIQHSILSPAIK